MKRIKRKKLKEDELVSTINKIFRYIQERTRELVVLLVIIAVVILIFWGKGIVTGQNRKKENRLLTQILSLHSELKEKPENVAKLEDLAGGGKFSRLANIFLAAHWMENGELDKAQASLERMPKRPKDIFFYQGQDLLAQIHFKRKNYEKAIEIYKKIEEDNPKDQSLDVFLFHRAEVHEEKGEIEAALALYRKIQEEFSQTYYGIDASQKILKLEEKK